MPLSPQRTRDCAKPQERGKPARTPLKREPEPYTTTLKTPSTHADQTTTTEKNATSGPTTNLATRNACETSTCSCTPHPLLAQHLCCCWRARIGTHAQQDRAHAQLSQPSRGAHSLCKQQLARPLQLCKPTTGAHSVQQTLSHRTEDAPHDTRRAMCRHSCCCRSQGDSHALNSRCPSKHSCQLPSFLPALQVTAAAGGAAAASAAAATARSRELHASFCSR
jgi:hypothetical protein